MAIGFYFHLTRIHLFCDDSARVHSNNRYDSKKQNGIFDIGGFGWDNLKIDFPSESVDITTFGVTKMNKDWQDFIKKKRQQEQKPKFNAKEATDAEIQRLYWVLQPDHDWHDSVKEEYDARFRDEVLEEFGIELEND